MNQHNKKELNSAGGVLFNPELNKFYLIHSTLNDEWKLPKGGIEIGESLAEAALREIREETGFMNLKLLNEIPIFVSNFEFEKDGTRYQKTVTYFLVFTSDKIKKHTKEMDQENLKGGWFAINEALNKSTFEDGRIVLNKANEILNQYE